MGKLQYDLTRCKSASPDGVFTGNEGGNRRGPNPSEAGREAGNGKQGPPAPETGRTTEKGAWEGGFLL